ncbi:MAG: hypothetical protein HOW97_02965 [Catenulispora sp.]|nr:hypothetical protein [Catenulispora sp.]
MSDNPIHPFTDCLAGLAVSAEALRTVAIGNQAVAQAIAEGITALRAELSGAPLPVGDDGREPGFFRIPLGIGATIDAAGRGELHVTMATVAAGGPEPDRAAMAQAAAKQILQIMADLWRTAGWDDLNVGCLIEESFAAVRARLADEDR